MYDYTRGSQVQYLLRHDGVLVERRQVPLNRDVILRRRQHHLGQRAGLEVLLGARRRRRHDGLRRRRDVDRHAGVALVRLGDQLHLRNLQVCQRNFELFYAKAEGMPMTTIWVDKRRYKPLGMLRRTCLGG